MLIPRFFTRAGHDPYEGINFTNRSSKIVNPDGSVVFEALDIQMPEQFSQVAVDIMAQKYFRKAGVPVETTAINEKGIPNWMRRRKPTTKTEFTCETDARQTFHRLAGTWAYWGTKYNYFDSKEDARAFYDELVHMMASQRSAPNSPQWFNTGLNWSYGIEGPAQGHSYVNPDNGEMTQSTSAYERPQPHACFIQSVADDLVNEGGIMDLWTREARIFKYGSGTGSNFSNIRGANESLSGGGKSSGLMSFLKIGDRAAGAIKSGGTTRRAAKMVIVDADHPDIEEFVDWKVKEEQKVASLITGSRVAKRHLKEIFKTAKENNVLQENKSLRKAIRLARQDAIPEGYIQRVLQLIEQGEQSFEFDEFDSDWQGEAYMSVSGQNSNNSVRVNADFLKAVEKNESWDLTNRTDGSTYKTVKAQDLWDRIGHAAWNSADPGLQFDTTINEWHTSPAGGKINGSNPCSEYMFLDDTACNLASINLLAFTNLETGEFDIEGYRHAIRLWTIVLEISVLMAQYPSDQIALLSYEYRTLGLGYANLGALLMLQGIPYDSDEALGWTGALTAIMTGDSYATSAEMASELGAFPRYSDNSNEMLRVIRNHRHAAYNSAQSDYEGLTVYPKGIESGFTPKELYAVACESWDRALELGEKHGYRNAQTTLIAPTGTIGLLMDCDTTGVEPDFALVKFKKLAGGGYFRIINESVPTALKRLGYPRNKINDIIEYAVGTQRLEGAPLINRISLAEHGFTQPLLDSLDQALSTAFHISFVFNRYQLGDDFCRETLQISDEDLNDPSFNLLQNLGFTPSQIEEANDYILGRMTVEGAPHLRESDYAVFDCANKCGKYGKRYIEPLAHVRIMAAAQPFIAGAISKTINMPAESTINDVKEVYMEASHSMIKALALYRDGSKLSQPLAAAIFDDYEDNDELLDSEQHPAVIAAEQMLHAIGRGQRESLPARRSGYAQKAKVGGHTIYIHTGEFEADPGEKPRVGELFIDTAKDGAAFRSLMNCFAIAVSMGLQYGVPLEKFVDTFVFTKFEPNGMVTGHDRIQFASSIIDYIFRELAVTYLGRDELAHLGPVELTTDPSADDDMPIDIGSKVDVVNSIDIAKEKVVKADELTQQLSSGIAASSVIELNSHTSTKSEDLVLVEQARQSGFEGDPCPECGQLMMVRNGTCLKCMACGTTTGCS